MTVRRANTILYTDRWAAMVEFYGSTLGLPVRLEKDWFVEFAVGPDAAVSVADAARTTILPGHGAGITLSLQVDDVHRARSDLVQRDADVGEVGTRWGADVLDLIDPAGNRIELWSEPTTDRS